MQVTEPSINLPAGNVLTREIEANCEEPRIYDSARPKAYRTRISLMTRHGLSHATQYISKPYRDT